MTVCAYLLAATLTGLLQTLLVMVWPAEIGPEVAFFGGSLAVCNGVAAGLINRAAIGPDSQRFWRRSGIGHGMRVTLWLGILCLGLAKWPDQPVGLVISAMTGYFCFFAAEIAVVHRRGSRSDAAPTGDREDNARHGRSEFT